MRERNKPKKDLGNTPRNITSAECVYDRIGMHGGMYEVAIFESKEPRKYL